MSDLGDNREQTDPDKTLSEQFERCAHCGATLPSEEWCPIRTDSDTDGNLIVRTFCDEACMERYSDRETNRSGTR